MQGEAKRSKISAGVTESITSEKEFKEFYHRLNEDSNAFLLHHEHTESLLDGGYHTVLNLEQFVSDFDRKVRI